MGDVVHRLLNRASRPVGEDEEHAGGADHPIHRMILPAIVPGVEGVGVRVDIVEELLIVPGPHRFLTGTFRRASCFVLGGHVAVRVDFGGDTERDRASDHRPRVIGAQRGALPHRDERLICGVGGFPMPGFRDRRVLLCGVDHQFRRDRARRPRVVLIQLGRAVHGALPRW